MYTKEQAEIEYQGELEAVTENLKRGVGDLAKLAREKRRLEQDLVDIRNGYVSLNLVDSVPITDYSMYNY